MFLIALFQEARHHEENGRSEDGLADLYRHVDTQDFVFAEKAPSSTRGVAPPRRKRLAAHAYQNSSQPRIHRINRQAGDEIEGGLLSNIPGPKLGRQSSLRSEECAAGQNNTAGK
jgi:hypothetical protein